MRDYGKIYSRYWRNNDILHTSDADKLLGTYLLTSTHTNLIGCSHLPIGYVTADLGWEEDKVKELLTLQEKRDFITRCSETNWLLINNYLKYNPIQNQNQGIAAYRLLLDIPDDFKGKIKLLKILKDFQSKLPASFITLYNQTITGSPISSSSKHESATTNTYSAVESYFEDFWQRQLRKEKKNKAQDIWIKLGLDKDGDRAMHVIHCWEDQKRHRKQYQDKSKTPLPHNWLTDKQWQDEFIRTDDPSLTPLNNPIKNHPQIILENNNQAVAQQWTRLSTKRQ